MAKCRFCNKEITWLKDGRKNVPVEGDGTQHKCEEMIKARNSTVSMDRDSLSAEEIKRYEDAINLKAQKTKK